MVLTMVGMTVDRMAVMMVEPSVALWAAVTVVSLVLSKDVQTAAMMVAVMVDPMVQLKAVVKVARTDE